MHDKPILQLNDRWRLAHDGQLQWVLQVRKGHARVKASGFASKRFYTSSTALTSAVTRLCGVITPAAEQALLTISQDRYTAWLASGTWRAWEATYHAGDLQAAA
jgi:hypothetical protein